MAISNYTELKDEVIDFMDRADLTGKAENFIILAEARLNRLIDSVEANITLATSSASADVDVSALKVIEPLALWETSGTRDVRVTHKAPGTFPYVDTVGDPAFYTVDGDTLRFDRPPSDSLSFRFRYRGRFALSDAAPTNDLLTNDPDVYLAATIMWGAAYTRDDENAANFKSTLDEFIRETKNTIAQKKRSVLSVDPALATSYRYNHETGV